MFNWAPLPIACNSVSKILRNFPIGSEYPNLGPCLPIRWSLDHQYTIPWYWYCLDRKLSKLYFPVIPSLEGHSMGFLKGTFEGLSSSDAFPLSYSFYTNNEDGRFCSSSNYQMEGCEVQFYLHWCSGACSHDSHNTNATLSLKLFKERPCSIASDAVGLNYRTISKFGSDLKHVRLASPILPNSNTVTIYLFQTKQCNTCEASNNE